MYLEKLHLKNIKLLRDVEIDFTRADGTPRLWTVLVGDNGVCKSTILQTIGLAASGPLLARKLSLSDRFRDARAPDERSEILASFRPPDHVDHAAWDQVARPQGDAFEVHLLLEPGRNDFVIETSSKPVADAIDDARAHANPGWFVVGYGIGRHLPKPGQVAKPDDLHVDRVEGVFDRAHKVFGIDFYDILRDEGLATDYSAALRDLLTTGTGHNGRLLPMLTNVELRGKDGVDRLEKLLQKNRFEVRVGTSEPFKLPATALSDGYQSMVAWIADLLGHAFLDRRAAVSIEELSGVVLLDEIDLHLHPTWQRRVVPILKKAFPKLQFIVTTHSPLVLTGFESDEIIRLELDGSEVVVNPGELEPGVLTASAILTSYFDTPRAGRPELVAMEREVLSLLGSSRLDDAATSRLEELQVALKPYLSAGTSTPPSLEALGAEDDG